MRDRVDLVGATAHRRIRELAGIARAWSPEWAVVTDPHSADQIESAGFPDTTMVHTGPEAVLRLICESNLDMVVAGVVGAAGLESSWAAIEAGIDVALANKETMVIAGPIVQQKLQETDSTLIPVDSEHSAIFHALQCGRRQDVRRVVLTSSGGPFRGASREQLEQVTPEAALQHPTWDMGPKITIDSATLLNKALEVIEARWLFNLEVAQIEVVVHPQSVVHSLVEFNDGSCLAQLSPPDMKVPIQFALTYPERVECPSPKMDWSSVWSLDFEPPDRDLFPALDLGFEAAERGGTCGAVLNAAKEVAVDRFLAGDLNFLEIPAVCRAILNEHNYDPSPSLTDLMRMDQWARSETTRWKSSLLT